MNAKTVMEVRIINKHTGEVVESKTEEGDTASAVFRASDFIAHGIDNIEVECLIKKIEIDNLCVKYTED